MFKKYIYIILLIGSVFLGGCNELGGKEATLVLTDCLSQYNLESYKSAMENCDKAIKLDETNSEGYVLRALIKNKIGDHESAIIDINRAIMLDSNNADYYYFRGYIKIFLRKYVSALKDFNKTIELDGNDIQAYRDRGTVKSQLRDFFGALEDFEKAIELKPENKELQEELQDYITLSKKSIEILKRHNNDTYIYNKRYYYGNNSGTDAGYEWAETNNIKNPNDCVGESIGFVQGCKNYVEFEYHESIKKSL